MFQFHKGTIKPVRAYLYVHDLQMFQFHKGTIKPDNDAIGAPTEPTFQFHKGTIKPLVTDVLESVGHSFNSIKVRLNPIRTKT